MSTEADAIATDLLHAMGRDQPIRSADGMVLFDPTTHVYRHMPSGRDLPSVTCVLEATGVREPYHGDPIYGIRGTWVHACAELVDQGDLDWDRAEAEHSDWLPYVRAYERFLRENTVEILGTEEVVWNERWFYAGRCDRRIMLNGVLTRPDLKSGQPQRSDLVQIAMYDETDPEHPHDLRPIYLRKDGNYRAPAVDPDDQAEARSVARAAAAIGRWRGRK